MNVPDVQPKMRVRVNGTHFTMHGQLGTVQSVEEPNPTNNYGEPLMRCARVLLDHGGEEAWLYPVCSLLVVEEWMPS